MITEHVTITGRLYKEGELEKLDKLANLYGVPNIERNRDAYSKIGRKGWWDPVGGIHPGLHLMNPVRGKFIVDVLEKYKVSKSGPILDIGCGGGILSEFLARKGYRIIGVDSSEGAIEVARDHALKSGLEITYQTGSVYNLVEYPDGYFSAVVCSDLLEHVPHLDRAMAEISRVLRMRSPFVFDTISRDDETVKMFMRREEDGRIPAGTHDPQLFINPDELAMIARNYGIRIPKDRYNPTGIKIKTMEDFDDKFELKDISNGSAVGHYLGYGIKS